MPALFRLLVLVFSLLGASSSYAAAEPLPPEQAFRLEPALYDGKTIIVSYTIAPGYYMYRTRFSFRLEPATVTLGAPQFPPGKMKDDAAMGRVEVYYNRVTIRIPVPAPLDPASTALVARSQGCSEAGLCYLPATARVNLVSASGSDAGAASGGGSLLDEATGKKKSPDALSEATDDSRLRSLLASRNWPLIIGTFMVLGLGLSLTACVYPLVPIVSGIIIKDGTTRGRGLWLSFAYSQGVALSYTVAGVLAGFTGTALAATLQQPWVLGPFAALFVVLALAMFGVIQLQLPSSVQSRLSAATARLPGGRFFTVLLMGMGSAAIIGPCMAPPLGAALLYISKSGDALTGGVALYALGLGLGLPLLAVGLFGASLLPRAGAWMNTIRQIYGVVLLGLALWIAQPLLSTTVLMALWAALLMGCAVFLHALDPLPVNASPVRRLAKAAGLMLLTVAVALLVGCLSGSRDPLQPLRTLTAAQAGSPRTTAPAFAPVHTPEELQLALASARGRPVIVDVYADWCIACIQMERETFAEPAVAAELQRFVRIKFDVTNNTDPQWAWMKANDLFGPPALLLHAGNGQLRTKLIGFQAAPALLGKLKEVQ